MTLAELAVLFDLAAGRKLTRADDTALETLGRAGMVTTLGRISTVSERGAAFIEFVQGLPLPEGGWSMPNALLATQAGQMLHPTLTPFDEDGPAPPAPPLKVPRIIEDPAARQAEAMRLMHAGFGLLEIKDELALCDADMTEYFGKWS